jgi:hypothetical protein
MLKKIETILLANFGLLIYILFWKINININKLINMFIINVVIITFSVFSEKIIKIKIDMIFYFLLIDLIGILLLANK